MKNSIVMKTETSFLTDDYSERLKDSISPSMAAFKQLQEKDCPGSHLLGWYDYPEQEGYKSLDEIVQFKKDLSLFYDLVVVVGIGGSYAGVRAVADVFSQENRPQDSIEIAYAGNSLSERELLHLIEKMDSYKPLVIVVSKSGNTLEPLIAYSVIDQYMHRRFGEEEANDRTIIVSGKQKSFLQDTVDARKCKNFIVPENIGGRFSVLTPVGLLPLAMAGLDIVSLMDGANRLFKELKEIVPEEVVSSFSDVHPVIVYAALRKIAWDDGKSLEVLAYNEPCLHGFSEWWKQLFGESEGKEEKGLFPVSASYSTDLHSLGQYMQEGPSRMIETFLSFRDFSSGEQCETRIRVSSQNQSLSLPHGMMGRFIDDINSAAMLAACSAHFERGIPCFMMTLPRLSEYHIGYAISFFQVACSLSALQLQVNPFDQPGVEAYKQKLQTMMQSSSGEC